MSATVVARALAAAPGARPLFRDLDLVIAPIGVIGPAGVNSAANSTVLQTLGRARAPDARTMTISPPTATIATVTAVREFVWLRDEQTCRV